MNLGVFNRVNYGKDSEIGGMYSEWASLTSLIQNGNEDSHSVLGKFPMSAGKEVAVAVVKQLATNLGFAQAAEPSPLTTDREVQWCMEVICFGMSLPLSEHDTIRDCVHVYCEWLSALHPVPKISVPRPVCEDPNLYARKMISHFHNLFIPRKGEGADTINRQAVLCHRVLRTLQHLAQVSNSLTRETWEALLLFLLAINDTLLAPPTVRDDVGDQLCERVLSVLFEVWLLACSRCFPSPPLWKTFRETCMNWRHRIALIEQWNRVNLALTARLLEFMYGPSFPELKISEEDALLIPTSMSNDCIAQSWFRFLHCLGNPANLCRPAVISQTQKFLQFAITSENVVDPCQHPCLAALPIIFLKAIKGIAGQVDAFLGIAQPYVCDDGNSSTDRDKKESGSVSHPTSATHSPTPPPQRRLAKSFSVAPSAVTKGIPKASLIGLTSSRATSSTAVSGHPASTPNSGPSSTSSLSSMASLGGDSRQPLAPARPKCNSILHMFGEWLFEAAHIGCEGAYHGKGFAQRSDGNANKRPSSLLLDSRKGSLSLSQPGSLTDDADIPQALTIDKYEGGRAEALGALCRIFCAKKTGEEILPVYLARFYLALQQGLQVNESRECGETLASILLNSADLFRLDLDGVQVLVPYVMDALEIVLPEKELKLKSTSVSKTDLRRASIHLLLSMLVLPLHFQNLTIKELGAVSSDRGPLTFAQLKPRLMNLLINALQVESDSQNAQMLLGGLLLSVQDSASAEEVEQVTQPDPCPGSDTTSNLLSSASDTISSLSLPSDYRSISLSGGEEYTDPVDDYPIGLNKNSAHALFVRATYLVCHRLISSWKTDLNVSLAALELLAGLARTRIRETDALECKRAVKWLCDYIVYQCWRPPPAHSKDLHSTIVAAFQCAAVWLVAHPYLLQDKDCLTTVLEVVELGISGSKSQGKPQEPLRMKDEKELKPASMRVRDAAEALLTIILEQVGYFPSPCGAESLWSLLDEVALLKHCNSWPGGDNSSKELAVDRFRYFVVENSTVLALLEEPLGNDQDPQPTVTVLIRGPFGRHAWTMQLRHLPRHKSGTKYHAPNPGRPVPMADVGVRHDVKHRYFPENVDRIPTCRVDKSIPSLESLLADAGTAAEHTHLSHLVEQQAAVEAAAGQKRCKETDEPFPECTPPPACHEFQTARLFLSHFGFLSLDAANGNMGSQLIALDTSVEGFCRDLETLDNMSSRTCDTVHVFYVRAGQKTAEEILSNVQSESTVSPHFLEFLQSLGWSVNVFQHPGWTGHISTSWRIMQPPFEESSLPSNHGGSLYNGDNQVLYWADASSEISFVVPTRMQDVDSPPQVDTTEASSHPSGQGWFERSISDNANSGVRPGEKPRTLSLDLDKSSGSSPGSTNGSGRRRAGAVRQVPMHSNTKVLVFWTESFEDQLQFPISDLLLATATGLERTRPPDERDYFVISLHALASGLLRVKLQGPAGGRTSLATPLVDGMVVSRRALGSLVRQTALNMCRRRRLDNDSYQPPHVRRRLKVQDLVQKYRCELTHPELLTYLFSDPPT